MSCNLCRAGGCQPNCNYITSGLLNDIIAVLDPTTRIYVVHDDLVISVPSGPDEHYDVVEERARVEMDKAHEVIQNHFKCKQHD